LYQQLDHEAKWATIGGAISATEEQLIAGGLSNVSGTVFQNQRRYKIAPIWISGQCIVS
jgi:hypothetical protein